MYVDARDYHLQKLYGISKASFDQLFEDQGGRCAICKSDTPSGVGWVVDHAHDTGTIRGILCSRCNSGIGFLQDSVEVVLSAHKYLVSEPPSIPTVDVVAPEREYKRSTYYDPPRLPQKIRPIGGCGYRGVSLTSSGRYRAFITHNHKQIWIGSFTTAEEAAIAYNAKAIALYGDKALLNAIPNGNYKEHTFYPVSGAA